MTAVANSSIRSWQTRKVRPEEVVRRSVLRGDRLNLSDVGFACRSMTERCHRGMLARIFDEFLRYI